jgi:hypothetical protein
MQPCLSIRQTVRRIPCKRSKLRAVIEIRLFSRQFD